MKFCAYLPLQYLKVHCVHNNTTECMLNICKLIALASK